MTTRRRAIGILLQLSGIAWSAGLWAWSGEPLSANPAYLYPWLVSAGFGMGIEWERGS